MSGTIGGYLAHAITVLPWIFGGLSPFILLAIALLLPITWTLALVALLSVQYITPPRLWPAFRKWVFSLKPGSYYDECELHVLGAIDKEKTMLCYHPHGCLCVGFAWNGAHTHALDEYKVTWLAVDVLTKLPLMGYVVNWFGNMRGASAPVMRRLLEAGRNVALIPGGFEEATIMKRGHERVYVRERAGFIKFALRYGYKVHPAYTFGESDTYSTFHWFERQRMWLNQFKIPAIAIFGNPLIPVFPRTGCRIHTFIGEALVLPHLPSPTDEQVKEWHTKYVAALQALFDAHKAEAGKPDAVLEIW